MAQHPYKAAFDRRTANRRAKLIANQVKPATERSDSPSTLPMGNKPCALLTPVSTHNT